MVEYRLVAVLSDGVVGLSSEYGRQLWACCKMRKQHICQVCKRSFAVGSEMYRPVGNSYNRMQRICEECIRFNERKGGKDEN